MPTSASACRTRSLTCALLQSGCACRTPYSTFFAAVFHANREYCWKTTARSSPGPSMGAPSSVSSPDVGSESPEMSRKSVVFPQPEWPTTHTKLAVFDAEIKPRSAVNHRRTRTQGPFLLSFHERSLSKFPVCKAAPAGVPQGRRRGRRAGHARGRHAQAPLQRAAETQPKTPDGKAEEDLPAPPPPQRTRRDVGRQTGAYRYA